MASLSDEQKRRIEENRRKAQALRAAKQKQPDVNSNSNSGPVRNSSSFQGNKNSASLNHANNHKPPNDPPQTFPGGSVPQRPAVPPSFGSTRPVAPPSVSGSSASSHGSFYSSGKPQPALQKPGPRPPNKNSSNQSFHQNSSSSTLNAAQQRQGLHTPGQALQKIMGSPSKVAPIKKKVRVAGKCVLKSRSRFEIQINYHAGIVEVFKTMDSKMYDSKTRQWSFDLLEYQSLIRKVGVIDEVRIEPLPKFVTQCFRNRIGGKNEPPRIIPEADLSGVDEKLSSSLMTFQRQGVDFGIYKNGRVLIADDMGLGKTIQAICLACYYQREWPVLVVVPSSVRFAWREQFLTWMPSLDPQSINVIVSGKDKCSSSKVNIVSYDLMTRHSEDLLARDFKVIIMDESHSLKNFKTARTKAAGPLLKRANRVILLSGTPALSRPSELFPQIASVDSRLFPNFREFGIRYCDGKEMPWGWNFNGSSNLEELQILLEENIMIRRLKKDVLKELPSKRREMVILDPSSVKVNKNMSTSHKLVDKLKGMDKRGALLEYFHETGKAKVRAVTEYVLDLLENDHKFLLFAHHQEMLDSIEQAVVHKKYRHIRIDGRTPAEERKNLCDKFQNTKDVKVAVLSITAANAGLNLTAASLVVFAELFWNPGILVQAEDRVHRLGQEDAVLIKYLVGTGTADDYIWPMVQQKLDILGRAGLSKDDFSTADTTALKDPKQNDIMSYFEESFFEESTDSLDQSLGMEDGPSSSPQKAQAPQQSASFGTPPRKTPRKKLAPSPGQTTLFKYFSPSPGKPPEQEKVCEEKVSEEKVSEDAKQAPKRTLFPEEEKPSSDEVAAKELADVMQLAEDGMFGDFYNQLFDDSDCEPSAPKKAKLS